MRKKPGAPTTAGYLNCPFDDRRRIGETTRGHQDRYSLGPVKKDWRSRKKRKGALTPPKGLNAMMDWETPATKNCPWGKRRVTDQLGQNNAADRRKGGEI